ncbi:GntR family transcriptional regulator [Lentilactobacillus sp. SPB1-3]|uniref:GntR family transcriptional regulator n=1 Tax=Lentilactobacillus terminaliae TaxID=3003483 RepID=A0ACD5DDX4_9LACO|nr:GntR family transcriptional regulator [Lentilactobacillus sp. SPB1-3]MCZ0977489.1 GntR family transcriptional regulator [Lentilactobacillus sp. SPB1-3]
MQFSFDGSEPIYRQVAEQIEETIVTSGFDEGKQIPSTTEISKEFHINPATVLKGMNMVVDKGLIEKRRGLGMFVTVGAREKILEDRRSKFYDNFVKSLVTEAKSLNISEEDLINQIKRGFTE